MTPFTVLFTGIFLSFTAVILIADVEDVSDEAWGLERLTGAGVSTSGMADGTNGITDEVVLLWLVCGPKSGGQEPVEPV